MGFISQTSGKVAISAAKYVWITHSGLCNLDHWSGDTAIEVCNYLSFKAQNLKATLSESYALEVWIASELALQHVCLR